MPINSRNKGATFERKVANILAEGLGSEVSRNLEQWRDGGHDLNGVTGFSIECKHCKDDSSNKWWEQAIKQAEVSGLRPLLIYRLNRKPIVWRFSAKDVLGFGSVEEFIEVRQEVALELIARLGK